MLSAYPACFIKEENGYSVIFPDLGVATCGPTLENATQMAVDCLAGYLYTLRRDGEDIPVPSPLDQIDPAAVLADLRDEGEEAFAYDTFVNLITVDVEEYAKRHFEKSVKKTLSIPAWLNEAALREHLNFSQILQDALKERLGVQ
ncbi:HicB family protein [Pseudoflavonifractor sp. 524-17]|uniref:type II toxin-antitoxin system HicB family antitoxin n=1 Tax=Pseudoflavonifractor sp. 524-17 TaxID=2304577 RepID=UPI00137A1724|nr:type II toxin-antitoxin system HicB family antitoxin [Pseudoflavonifractor sp. 524-17]NCE66066.1 HicB family protein [Pseudoflavonifractor sp. 524-17]